MTTARTVSACLCTLAAALASACSRPAIAHPVGSHAPYVVTVEDDRGNTLRTFHHRGETFVLGQYGGRYGVRIRNQSDRRVEAVVSVDGRDAVSGKVGDYVSQRGYLIAPGGSVLVEGFRQSLDRVAAFRFTNPRNSYSSRMGTPRNVGVIGVAFFPEKAVAHRSPRWHQRHFWGTPGPTPSSPRRSGENRGADGERSSASADGHSSDLGDEYARAEPGGSRPDDATGGLGRSSRSARPRAGNLGTEYGESRSSHVDEVTFERESARHPRRVIALRYDDRHGLMARGIVVDHHAPVARHDPNPFPRNDFAPPPPPIR